MIQTIAQREYFSELTSMATSNIFSPKIDILLDEMLAEYDHNIIGMQYEEAIQLLRIIEGRFKTIPMGRILNPHIRSFSDKIKWHGPIHPNYDLKKIMNSKEAELELPDKRVTKMLKWTGSKSQMYYVIRQLKNMQILASSYEDIGLFLIQNIDKFDGSDLGTVINELQKRKYDTIPKNKRTSFSEINELKED